MKHELPKLQNTPVIPIDHFPTRMQCCFQKLGND